MDGLISTGSHTGKKITQIFIPFHQSKEKKNDSPFLALGILFLKKKSPVWTEKVHLHVEIKIWSELNSIKLPPLELHFIDFCFINNVKLYSETLSWFFFPPPKKVKVTLDLLRLQKKLRQSQENELWKERSELQRRVYCKQKEISHEIKCLAD